MSQTVLTIDYAATLPSTTTGGTAPLAHFLTLSENMQKNVQIKHDTNRGSIRICI